MPSAINEGQAAHLSKEYAEILQHNDQLRAEKAELRVPFRGRAQHLVENHAGSLRDIAQLLLRQSTRIDAQIAENQRVLYSILATLLWEEPNTPASNTGSYEVTPPAPIEMGEGVFPHEVGSPNLTVLLLFLSLSGQ